MGRLVRIRTAVIQLSSGTVLVIKVKKQKKKTEIFRVYKDFEKKKKQQTNTKCLQCSFKLDLFYCCFSM